MFERSVLAGIRRGAAQAWDVRRQKRLSRAAHVVLVGFCVVEESEEVEICNVWASDSDCTRIRVSEGGRRQGCAGGTIF